jgi:hypothetical protein
MKPKIQLLDLAPRPRSSSASERGVLFKGRREKTFRKPSRMEALAAGRLTLRLVVRLQRRK